MMLSEKLKHQTRDEHQMLEVKMIKQIKLIADTSKYSEFLLLFYRFMNPLETQIDKELDPSFLSDYKLRRKSILLVQDLSRLQSSAEIFSYDEVIFITNNLEAIGALYVMEGSTLGGQIISKMINHQLGLEKIIPLDFFNGYKNDTILMWQNFKIAMDQLKLNESEENIIIRSANNTFKRFSNLFDQKIMLA